MANDADDRTVQHQQEPLRSAALQNAQSLAPARERAEQELLETREALEDETRILELLNRTGAAFASELDVQSLVRSVTEAGKQLSDAEFGAFVQSPRTAPDREFILALQSNSRATDFVCLNRSPLVPPSSDSASALVRIADIGADPRMRCAAELATRDRAPRARSYIAVPVVCRSGEVLGVLRFGHSRADFFTERTERILAILAAQAAIAIDNACLYESLNRAAEERARLLTAERVARAEVERVSLIKDEFLATLSHELRTPLNAVLGWAEVLLLRDDMGEEIRRGVETIARNAKAQARLIDDLLDMHRIVSGKMRLDVQRTDLRAAVEHALDSVRPSIEAKAIRLRTLIDARAQLVLGDSARLQQVVWNLLSNAIKFTPQGGEIELRLAVVESQVQLTIKDSGIGIAPEFLPKVFDRFRQADASTTRRHAGLGLGLSIVKKLVELHGGSVRAESPGAGLGATFVVSLPFRAVRGRADAAGPAREPAASAQRTAGNLSGVRILVLDDEPDARELIRQVLTNAKADVLSASSVDEALALFETARPAVLVSDIGMPDRDGYQLIQAVRALPPARGGLTPAIALTALARAHDRTRALLAGYQSHMAKPIDGRELVRMVADLAGGAERGPGSNDGQR